MKNMGYIPFFIVFFFHQTMASNSDRSSLLSFKSLISNDPYGELSSWNDTTHHCEWTGVKCGRHHPERVTSLVLDSLELSGYISPALANLTFLQTLNLSNNQLAGGIPEDIGRCRRLWFISFRNNSLDGNIPTSLSNCSNLQVLSLINNKLQGTIPPSLGNLSYLSYLGLAGNNINSEIPSSFGGLESIITLNCALNQISGEIPAILGQLRFLEGLFLEMNNLSGQIPHSIYNLTSLTNLHLSSNRLEGSLPIYDLCTGFPNLQILILYNNNLNGRIPASISNCSALNDIELDHNNFTGTIPSNIGNLKNLIWLELGANPLEARTPSEWSFMHALTNCTFLKGLVLGNSQLQGAIPSSIGNLSTSLAYLGLQYNPISGNLPASIGRLVGLTGLDISGTLVGGTIPLEMGNLWRLQELLLSYNMLSGEIPSSFANLTNMDRLYLENNAFEGSLLKGLSGMHVLELFNLKNNKLSGEIPKALMDISSLSYFIDLSNNRLNGSLPSEIGNLKNIARIYLSSNRLSGEIPSTIGGCQLLQVLVLDGNLFQGTIPSSLGNLAGLQFLDLSNNSLSGSIPKFIAKMNLQFINLSFNNFEGELPELGVFKNVSAIDVRGNPKLCGGVPELRLPKCTSTQKPHSQKKKIIFSSISAILICLLIVTCFFVFRHWRKYQETQQVDVVTMATQYKQVSYDEIFSATNGFSSENLIGMGSFGVVYRAVMSFENATIVAVKVLNLDRHGASRSFLSECDALRNIKHRNLIKVLSSCSSIDNRGNDFKALIFEFMSNGSLETWLHLNSRTNEPLRRLSIIQTMNIAIDVASALEYLHHHGSVPIIHCDIKPSNILLDDDMTAHVGDFGLAKFLVRPDNDMSSQQTASTVGIKGSIGYIPPEYGMGGKASEQGDMYSFGILLLEMFTGVSPTDDRFKDGFNLHNFVAMSFPDKIIDVIDTKLVHINGDKNNGDNMLESFHDCLVIVIQCGLFCSKESPQERAGIKQVVKDLNSARMKLLK